MPDTRNLAHPNFNLGSSRLEYHDVKEVIAIQGATALTIAHVSASMDQGQGMPNMETYFRTMKTLLLE